MNYYKIIVNCGKFLEVTRYFKDYNIINDYCCSLNIPRSKKTCSVKLVKEISFHENMLGKLEEENNPYLNIRKGGKVYA